MNQKYFKRLPLFFILIALSFTAFAQTTLSTIDQSLRYSLYARLGLKIIPIKLSESSYKLQFVVEKIEAFIRTKKTGVLKREITYKKPYP